MVECNLLGAAKKVWQMVKRQGKMEIEWQTLHCSVCREQQLLNCHNIYCDICVSPRILASVNIHTNN